MKHPYEAVGMITAAVVTVVILSYGVAAEIDGNIHDYVEMNHIGSGPSGGTDANHWNIPPVLQPIPEPKHPMSYYYENQAKQQCKVLANDLQQFADCVNFGFVCVEWDDKLKCSLTSNGGKNNP